MKKIRILDVANHAGVSKSTISHYLNGRFARMSLETKERISKTIEELNYTPSHIARSLKSNSTNTIGVIVRDITGHFTSKVIRGIDDYCKESKFDVLIYNTDYDPVTEAQSLKKLRQLRVDGVIIASSGKNSSVIAKEIKAGFPVVMMHLEYKDLDASIVLADNKQGAFDATEHLIKLGHKRICLHTLDYHTSISRQDRVEGYKAALEKYDIPFDESLVHLWTRDKGLSTPIEDIMNMENPPTAFLSLYLEVTRLLLKEFKRLEISIPNDVSFLSFDEIPMVEHFKVPITVITQNPHEMGMESARMLIDMITNEDTTMRRSIQPCELIERESCTPPKQR
ncbi:LacI family transcriptional regulator [Leucothrix sargassi]|nr:LacI family transcriptional regulator [Leucothrix sargassi]